MSNFYKEVTLTLKALCEQDKKQVQWIKEAKKDISDLHGRVQNLELAIDRLTTPRVL